MGYYQEIAVEYLRSHRHIFVNTECLIQLNDAENPDGSGPHWYCDALAVDFGAKAVYLCEVSYATGLGALLKRLKSWNSHWPELCTSLARDCCLRLPDDWQPPRPWLFIPNRCVPKAIKGITRLQRRSDPAGAMPVPCITSLESIAPWKYHSWNGHMVSDLDDDKIHPIPDYMKISV